MLEPEAPGLLHTLISDARFYLKRRGLSGEQTVATLPRTGCAPERKRVTGLRSREPRRRGRGGGLWEGLRSAAVVGD